MSDAATRTRTLAILCAAIGWTGLIIQLALLVAGPLGPIGGTWRFLAFFTVLTNMFAAALYTLAVLKPDFLAAQGRLYSAAAVYLTTVGVTYVTLLQARWAPQGWALIADRIMHHLAPAAAVIFWLVCVPKSDLKYGDAARWAGAPMLYLVYALARARFDGFYPYFFIDAGQLGWRAVALNAAAMLIGFLLLGLIFVAAAKLLSRDIKKRA